MIFEFTCQIQRASFWNDCLLDVFRSISGYKLNSPKTQIQVQYMFQLLALPDYER